jgi:hypothetical protein
LRVSAVADLNGDGSLEIVISDNDWEGGGVGFVERTPDGYQRRLYAGCGA